MEIKLRLGGVLFLFRFPRPRIIDPALVPFIVDTPELPELTVRLSWDWAHVRLPVVPMVGEDALLEYYVEPDARFCLTKGGPKGYVAAAEYTPDFRMVLCTMHDEPFLVPPKKLGSTLRMLPMREIFLHFKTLFLHAAQVSYQGRGILFTAPSGTGKTTQARLWKRHRGVKILCNDRTLVRRAEGLWRTYGYPLDGSEPVCSEESSPLAAIVLLEQGLTNEVRKLSPVKALPRLMPQVVLDTWSGEAHTRAMELLIEVMREIPVYLLSCTPDEGAVTALEAKLRKDKVLPFG